MSPAINPNTLSTSSASTSSAASSAARANHAALAAEGFAVSLALQYVIDTFFTPKEQFPPVRVTTQGSAQPQRIVYGTTRVSGPIVFQGAGHKGFTVHGQTVSARAPNHLFWVIPLAGHQCEAFKDIYLDDFEIKHTEISWGADGGGTSYVLSGLAYRTSTDSYVRAFAHLGSITQTANARLTEVFAAVPNVKDAAWTAQHRGQGIAYAVLDLLKKDSKRWRQIFHERAPSTVGIVVQGKNNLYDPRLDTQPGADPANAAYQQFSSNPALCVADYLTDGELGMGVPTAHIDWDSVVTAATECDTLVDGLGPVLPGNTLGPRIRHKRFTSNGALLTRDTHRANLTQLLATMLGALSVSGGKVTIHAHSWTAPVESFDENDLIQPLQLTTHTDVFSAFNTIRGTYLEAAEKYEERPFSVRDATLRTNRDNGETLIRDLALPMTTSRAEAQRLAYFHLQQAAFGLTATLHLNYKGLRLRYRDRITLSVQSLGWDDKIFRVEAWRFEPLGGVVVTVREDAASAYDDPPVTWYEDQDSFAPKTLPAPVVPEAPPPTNLAATGISGGIEVTWTLPEPRSQWDEIVLYAADTDAWTDAEEIWRGVSTAYVHLLNADTTRYYWARAVQGEDLSLRAPDADTSTVTATALGLLTAAFKPGASGSPIPNSPTDPLHIEVSSGVIWSGGWWQSADGQWWWLWHAADVPSFTRAQANFYIPWGDIRDVPTT